MPLLFSWNDTEFMSVPLSSLHHYCVYIGGGCAAVIDRVVNCLSKKIHVCAHSMCCNNGMVPPRVYIATKQHIPTDASTYRCANSGISTINSVTSTSIYTQYATIYISALQIYTVCMYVLSHHTQYTTLHYTTWCTVC